MPTLSFILSGLLVGAGSIYLYLSQTNKIEKTKQKIAESNKVTYLAKKSSLTLSSVKNIDTNNSFDIIATTGDKLSNFVAKDDDIDTQKLMLLNRCQKEVEKIIMAGKTPNQESIPSCQKLEGEKFEFYGLSSSGVDIPEDSILKKDKTKAIKLQKKLEFALLNEKIIDKKIKEFKRKKYIQKKLASIKTSDMDKIKERLHKIELSKYKENLEKLIRQKNNLLIYKKSLLQNISSLEKEVLSFAKLKKDSSAGIISGMVDSAKSMFGFNNSDKNHKKDRYKQKDVDKNINITKSKLISKKDELKDIDLQLANLNSQIQKLEKKLNLKGKKDD